MGITLRLDFEYTMKNVSLLVFPLMLAAAMGAKAAPQSTDKGASMKDMPMGGMKMDVSEADKKAFAALDKNHDGKVSKEEAAADKSLSPHFAMLDMDKDGNLDVMEFAMRHGM